MIKRKRCQNTTFEEKDFSSEDTLTPFISHKKSRINSTPK